jgi:hypothetical protein
MAEDVQDLSVGVANEEATNTPRLVREWVNNLATQPVRRIIGGVYVIDLDRRIWLGRRGGVLLHDRDLRARAAGSDEGHDPSKIHRYFEPEHVGVEPPAPGGLGRLKVRHDPYHAHWESMTNAAPCRPAPADGGLSVSRGLDIARRDPVLCGGARSTGERAPVEVLQVVLGTGAFGWGWSGVMLAPPRSSWIAVQNVTRPCSIETWYWRTARRQLVRSDMSV